MKRLSSTIPLFAFAFVLARPALGGEQAEATNPPPETVCKTSPAFSEFDFWLGDWKVYSNDEKRTFEGTNRVTKLHQGCLVMENWTSARGNTGSSMNYYDPLTGKWRQLWVSNGYAIDYSGGLDAHGSMRLEGKIHYYRSGKSFPFRGVWTANSDGSVRQLFEQFDPEKNLWKTWFDGLYVHSSK